MLIRADGQVLYTLASVVDDTEMGVTHVVRGNDHVTNTATQIQIIQRAGRRAPVLRASFAADRPAGRGAVEAARHAVAARPARARGRADGAAVADGAARVLAAGGAAESLDELADGFDLATFGAAPTKFDERDLFPLTARKLHALPFDGGARATSRALGVPDDEAEAFWTVCRDNIETRHDLKDWWALFRDGPAPLVAEEDRDFIAQAFDMLGDPPYDQETWSGWTNAVKEATGRKGKGLFMPLRKAVTGLERGPEMADVMPLLQVRPRLG